MEEKIKVIAVRPGKPPVLMDIENSLSALQEFVDGYIEVIRLDDETVLLCNEDGKTKRLPPNRCIIIKSGRKAIKDVIVGNFLILRAGVFDEEFRSLSESQVQKFMEAFC